MINIRLKRYKKEFAHSYCFGVFPTLELLHQSPQYVLGVIANPKGIDNSGISKIQDICQINAIPFEFHEKTFSRIGARQNDYAVAIFQKAEKDLETSTNHVILVNPSGMGNIGTIIRTMLGFNYYDLAIIQNAVDIFHPEVVRASMGALFSMRFHRFSNFESYQETFPLNFYLMMTDGDELLPLVKFEPAYGLVFGPENAGLSEVYRDYGTSIKIPQSQSIDSLNLAVSVGITLYQSAINNNNLFG
ncbi:MAG: TrmH family RNA methyltransferase [Anaerolineales bacterium]